MEKGNEEIEQKELFGDEPELFGDEPSEEEKAEIQLYNEYREAMRRIYIRLQKELLEEEQKYAELEKDRGTAPLLESRKRIDYLLHSLAEFSLTVYLEQIADMITEINEHRF